MTKDPARNSDHDQPRPPVRPRGRPRQPEPRSGGDARPRPRSWLQAIAERFGAYPAED